MTNLEAIKAKAILNYPIDDNTYTVALIDAGLNPSDNYTDQRTVDLCIADLVLTILSGAKQIQDDGYSVTLFDDLWKLRAFYRRKWGLPDDRPSDVKTPILKDATSKW